MVSRPQLSLVPVNGLRGRVRPPSRRLLAVTAGLVALLGLGYLAARETPLFALREVEVTGAPKGLKEEVRRAAAPFLGESLVALDRAALSRSLEALPAVRSLRIDRAFPHSLRIAVVPEHPLAVLRRGGDAWILSERGRVLRRIDRDAAAARPRVWTGQTRSVEVGKTVAAEPVQAVLAALRRVPEEFPVRIRSARAEADTVVFVLADETELRLGERTRMALKLEVAASVLRGLDPAEREELAYLDVTVPERPVGAGKSQVSS
ncbi:MAG: cell division protein FtsQ/DivIB [Gaiellaceae bacterium]